MLDAEDFGMRDDGGGSWALSLPQRRRRVKATHAGFASGEPCATFGPGGNDEQVLHPTRWK